MKFSIISFVVTLISCTNSYPYRQFADFELCGSSLDLQTLWPDWNDNTLFYQCMGINIWGTHRCPAGLLFSFEHQVCVWPSDWVPPPPQGVITPFPTTPWPTIGSSVTQELTVPPEETTPGIYKTRINLRQKSAKNKPRDKNKFILTQKFYQTEGVNKTIPKTLFFTTA